MVVHSGSGNNTWVDYPSTSTQITATALENIENKLDTPFACLRRWRNGNFTATNGLNVITMNATDSASTRGTGLSASGDGIAVTSASLVLVDWSIYYVTGTTSDRGAQIYVNGAIVRDAFYTLGATVRASGSAIIGVNASAVITLGYYVAGSPTISGGAVSDTALSVLRLTT